MSDTGVRHTESKYGQCPCVTSRVVSGPNMGISHKWDSEWARPLSVGTIKRIIMKTRNNRSVTLSVLSILLQSHPGHLCEPCCGIPSHCSNPVRQSSTDGLCNGALKSLSSDQVGVLYLGINQNADASTIGQRSHFSRKVRQHREW